MRRVRERLRDIIEAIENIESRKNIDGTQWNEENRHADGRGSPFDYSSRGTPCPQASRACLRTDAITKRVYYLERRRRSPSGGRFQSTNNPREFVESHAAVYELFARGLTNECQAPLSKNVFRGMNAFRKVAHALKLKGRVLESDGQWENAADTYLQIIQLGEGIEHGAIIHLLVGISIEKIGLANLKPALLHVGAKERKMLCDRLVVINKNRINFREVQERDHYYAILTEPNFLKRLWYNLYWHLRFFGLNRAPDPGEMYKRLIAEIDEAARSAFAQ
jgi:hypothetical protein